MKATKPGQGSVQNLQQLRARLKHGDNTNQHELDQLCADLDAFKPAADSSEEIFPLVDSQGNYSESRAPRWLCHFLGLRHKSVHVLLRWLSPSMGSVFILQVRSWRKSDSPGHLDISVGGHVTSNNGPPSEIDSAYREMKEELGVQRDDLENRELLFQAGYESYDQDESRNFYNAEWRDVYMGILLGGLDRIRLNDGEVVGLYLCPELEAKNLLKQTFLPLASALRLSLPPCLSHQKVKEM